MSDSTISPSSTHGSLPKTAEAAAAAIGQLQHSAESRLIALGSHYAALNVADAGRLKEIEDDLRRARLYEAFVLHSVQRRCELDAQRRALAEAESVEAQRRADVAALARRLQRQALEALAREAAAERDADTAEADRRAILERERTLLLERRRAFDRGEYVPTSGGGGTTPGRSGTPGGRTTTGRSVTAATARGATPTARAVSPAVGGRAALGVPIVVMNVALGNGREDRLVVREGDDPRRVAVTFARRHGLPEHAVHTLQTQIVQNAKAYEAKRALTGSIAPAAQRSGTPGRAAAGTGVLSSLRQGTASGAAAASAGGWAGATGNAFGRGGGIADSLARPQFSGPR